MHRWVMPCNWKFPAENFGGDAYHVQWTHLSAIKTSFSTGITAKPNATGALVSPGGGHVLICVGPDDVGEPPVPEILAYEEEIRAEVEQRLGPRRRLINPIVGLAWGVLSLLVGWRQRAGSRLAVALLASGLTLCPWTVRNYLVFGRPANSGMAELYRVSQWIQRSFRLDSRYLNAGVAPGLLPAGDRGWPERG